ncbi:MAG: hypothetical protein ACOC0W_06970, partial [Desulfosalsimonas sp.]
VSMGKRNLLAEIFFSDGWGEKYRKDFKNSDLMMRAVLEKHKSCALETTCTGRKYISGSKGIAIHYILRLTIQPD